LSYWKLFFVNPTFQETIERNDTFTGRKHLIEIIGHFLIVEKVYEHVAQAHKVILAGGFFELELSHCRENNIAFEFWLLFVFADMKPLIVDELEAETKVDKGYLRIRKHDVVWLDIIVRPPGAMNCP
jgi:hypothetical protein